LLLPVVGQITEPRKVNHREKFEVSDSIFPTVDVPEAVMGLFREKKQIPKPIDTIPYHFFPSVLPGVGYSILTGPSLVLASNVSFYTGSAKNTNLSSILFSPEYGIKGQGLLVLNSNLWSSRNRINWVGDNKYYYYTVNDYGLGANSVSDQFNSIRFRYLQLHNLVNRKLRRDFFLGLGQYLSIHRKIQPLTNNTILVEQFANEKINRSVSSALEMSLLLDRRRNSNHPISPGSYVNFIYRNHMKSIGSTSKYQSYYLDVRKYIAIKKSSKMEPTLCLWLLQQYTRGKIPYWDMPSTMWDPMDNSGRPFIQGRFRSRQMVNGETELRFNLLKNKMLGGAIWGNVVSMSDKNFSSFKHVVPAAGGSLRILLNKDALVYFVISYGISKNRDRGLFLNLGEVF
jgi:hypothetical protein